MPKLLNAQNCSNSLKHVRNNSIYCLVLDQWLSVRYCENVCRAYNPEEIDPSTIPQEVTVDNTGPIRDESGKAVSDPDHVIDQTDDGDQTN